MEIDYQETTYSTDDESENETPTQPKTKTEKLKSALKYIGGKAKAGVKKTADVSYKLAEKGRVKAVEKYKQYQEEQKKKPKAPPRKMPDMTSMFGSPMGGNSNGNPFGGMNNNYNPLGGSSKFGSNQAQNSMMSFMGVGGTPSGKKRKKIKRMGSDPWKWM